MNEIIVFDNPEFGNVRTVMKDGEPWFAGKDVCAVFGDTNHNRSLSRLFDGDKEMIQVKTAGGKQSVSFVNEAGLYSLLFSMQPQKTNHEGVQNAYPPEIQARIDKLSAFKRWVTHEVLPSIRKHGIFATDDTIEKILDDPDFGITLLTRLKDERKKRAALEAKLEADKPYTEFAQSIANSSDSVHVGDFAKLVCNSGINIGRNRLFRWMRESGYLMESNRPYQRYVDQGLFEVQEYCVHTAYGDLNEFTTMITGKGQMVLMEALRKVA